VEKKQVSQVTAIKVVVPITDAMIAQGADEISAWDPDYETADKALRCALFAVFGSASPVAELLEVTSEAT
jgi:hypothetical protein